ncbi:hypothetical protein R83H12_01038 [Fibrobacteria bacterium R8-3-H12]
MPNQTAQLFDLMFKYILKEASSPAVVHFINGLFDKNYNPNSKVEFSATESVSKKQGKLGKIMSDIILKVNGDSFLIETQIKDDLEIALRAFQYAFANAKNNKEISDDSLIKIRLPEPKIIYFESTAKTPDMVTLQIEYPKGRFNYEVPTFKVLDKSLEELAQKKMALILPFYLLKFRKEIKKKNTNSKKRKEIASKMTLLLEELGRILIYSLENSILSNGDISVLCDEIKRMHIEIYGCYKEFTEVQMTLMEKVRSPSLEAWKRKEKSLVKQGVLKALDLMERGYKPAEIKKMAMK